MDYDIHSKGGWGLGKVSHPELPVTLLESVREEHSEVSVVYTHVHM